MDPVGSFSVRLDPVWILSGRLGEIVTGSFFTGWVYPVRAAVEVDLLRDCHCSYTWVHAE